jgi:hypothetical protein
MYDHYTLLVLVNSPSYFPLLYVVKKQEDPSITQLEKRHGQPKSHRHAVDLEFRLLSLSACTVLVGNTAVGRQSVAHGLPKK